MEDVATMSTEAAEAEIADVQGDPSHPYWSDNHPGKDAAKDRMTALYEVKSSGDDYSDDPIPAYDTDADTGNSVTNDFQESIADAMAAPASPDDYDFTDLRVQHGDDETYDTELETAN